MRLRLFGTVVELSYPLAAAVTAMLILDRSAAVFACLMAALLHELGHICALKRFGAMPERIRLSLFDAAIIDRKKLLRKNSREIIVVLAGVAANYVFAAAGTGLYLLVKNEWLLTFASANLVLGLFNSLPVDSLDGGQALMMILTFFFSYKTAEAILLTVSVLILAPIACAGFLLLFYTRYNFTLLTATLYLVSVIFLRNKKRLLQK